MNTNEPILTEEKIDFVDPFTIYGIDEKSNPKKIKYSELILIEDGLLARTEKSGSEGWYVEVARWNETNQSYQRFCFLKLFDQSDADEITNAINYQFRSDLCALIHSLQNYGE
jgi:hypothetical protein